jgi:hypothetical protein
MNRTDGSDGGPAFPQGMTLRDYFATHAPAPEEWLVMSIAEKMYGEGPCSLTKIHEISAKLRYAYADAMLKRREM